MRTTIDIPKDLVDEAMKITNYGSKTELIKQALREIIQKHKIQALKQYKGKIDLNINLDHLRDRDENTGR